MDLNKEQIARFLKAESPLFKQHKYFEERREQQEMLSVIIDAFNEKNFALIEAGTGIGKSLAYLLPALMHAVTSKKKTVISTHTITLQEQLISKDIPTIINALNLDVEAILVKGMSNYLCLRKLFDLTDHASLHSVDEQEDLRLLEDWSNQTTDGSLSDLKKMPKKMAWDKVKCESEACTFVKCPHYNECFFFKARKKCRDANILISNHHLLLADLQLSEDSQSGGILPDYENLIIDEAHTLEDIAMQSLASSISAQYLMRKLNELVTDKGHTGKLQRLKLIFNEFEDSVGKRVIEQTLDLFSEKKVSQTILIESFTALGSFISEEIANEGLENKVALDASLRNHKSFKEVVEQFDTLIHQLNGFSLKLCSFIEICDKIENPKITKKTQNILIDLQSFASFLEKSAATITSFFNPSSLKDRIYVLERNMEKSLSGLRLMEIQINVSDILASSLLSPCDSAVLCSATLSHNRDFSFVKKQLGLNQLIQEERKITEKILNSPFDYREKVFFATPRDMPQPSDYMYTSKLCSQILEALTVSQGGAFVLFTSFKTLNQTYESLSSRLIERGLLSLKQGDESRNTLLEIFKNNANSVLFGTDTFWEGIDVPGSHLRLVIITKLPFPVPSEPIFQAKCKQIESLGRNPFMEYSVPKAIVKFKQGFGRLIRRKEDFGSVLCLDSRIINKRYGQYFFNSLPTCHQYKGSVIELGNNLANFYARFEVKSTQYS